MCLVVGGIYLIMQNARRKMQNGYWLFFAVSGDDVKSLSSSLQSFKTESARLSEIQALSFDKFITIMSRAVKEGNAD
jgi:hypothetical protein